MHEVLRLDRTKALLIAGWLDRMACDGDLPDDDSESEMLRFWDAMDLALEETLGDVEEITDELLEFLKKYAEESANR